MCSNKSIKVAAIVFQINPCLILSGVSMQSTLDPVLAYLLQHMWYKLSPRIPGLPGRQQQLQHWGEVLCTPLCRVLHLHYSWGSASTCSLLLVCAALAIIIRSLGSILCIWGYKIPSFLLGHSPFK